MTPPSQFPSPPDRDIILRAIADVKQDVCDVKADVREVKDEVKEVKAEARLTNGRLRAVELWRHGLEAVVRANAWVRPAVIAFLSGAGITVLSWYLATRGGG